MDLAGPVFQAAPEGPAAWGQLFAEELGLVLEVAQQEEAQVVQAYQSAGLSAQAIGSVTSSGNISIRLHGHQHLAGEAAAKLIHSTVHCDVKVWFVTSQPHSNSAVSAASSASGSWPWWQRAQVEHRLVLCGSCCCAAPSNTTAALVELVLGCPGVS